MLAVAATCLVAALVGAPTAGAASSGNHAKAGSAQKAKASVTKRKLARDIASVRRRTNAARRTLRTLGRTLAALQATLNDVKTKGEGTQGQVNGILAAVPGVLDALVQLRDGSLALKAGLEQAGAGLLALKTGVEQLAAGTKELGDFVQAQEYGSLGLFAANGGGAVCCRIITSGTADIPDDGNNVAAGGVFPLRVVSSGANPANGTFAEDTEVMIRASIRSNESDGDGDADDPAGQVGALMHVKCASIGGCGSLPIGPGGADVPISSGDIVCAVGPTPTKPHAIPGGTAPLGVVDIPLAVDRADQAHPDASVDDTDVNPLGDPDTPESDAGAAGTADPAGNSTDKNCTLANAGTYEVTVQAQFVDIPLSEDPGPTE